MRDAMACLTFALLYYMMEDVHMLSSIIGLLYVLFVVALREAETFELCRH